MEKALNVEVTLLETQIVRIWSTNRLIDVEQMQVENSCNLKF